MSSTPDNPLIQLERLGQSVWLDYISRDILSDGTLCRLIDDDGLSGVTSNPAIFQRAIASGVYEDTIAECKAAGMSPDAIYERIAVDDVARAADLLQPVYERTGHRDGFVSLEVSPHLAGDAERTCVEARRLWSLVGRANLMIKVPATPAGLDAIATLIGEGLNINVTLLFARDVYRKVALAYMQGLETWTGQGGDPASVAGVASFFVSRIDTAVDSLIDEMARDATPALIARLGRLKGEIAIASAKVVYRDWRSLFSGPGWEALAEAGARSQRLLWGSTSTKNPAYRDVRYVEELIGPGTVNTIPMPTLEAFRDHGRVRTSLTEAVDEAELALSTLSDLGICLEAITSRLTIEGVDLFSEAHDKVLAGLC